MVDRRTQQASGSAAEVLSVFLKLGLTSFGGPVAHLGYFRDELVIRRRWMDEAAYADTVALCQLLPGPASSQVGFALGVCRGGGLLGGLAAWAGFTLPSAFALVAFALGAHGLGGRLLAGIVHGLGIVAVAVVAQAVWGMARSLAPDPTRASIAVAALALATWLSGAKGQCAAILLGACAGLIACRGASRLRIATLAFPISRWAGAAALALFLVLFAAPVLPRGLLPQHGVAVFDAFYRSGALVFGGGHVVLPLLQAQVVRPGWISPQSFLAGYGAAQAVPGPLFSFAAYLGAALQPGAAGAAWAALALVAIFLPGLLLVTGALPFWDALRGGGNTQAALRGINAAVVGVLAGAFYRPVWTSAVGGAGDFALAAASFVLLMVWRAPAWLVVVLTTLGGVALSSIPPTKILP